jgi:hypothetical protein
MRLESLPDRGENDARGAGPISIAILGKAQREPLARGPLANRREGKDRDMRLLPCSLKRSNDGKIRMASM